MTDKNIDIYAAIDERRLKLEEELRGVIDARDRNNERIKQIRAELDDLPVRRVRRTKKAKAEGQGDD